MRGVSILKSKNSILKDLKMCRKRGDSKAAAVKYICAMYGYKTQTVYEFFKNYAQDIYPIGRGPLPAYQDLQTKTKKAKETSHRYMHIDDSSYIDNSWDWKPKCVKKKPTRNGNFQ